MAEPALAPDGPLEDFHGLSPQELKAFYRLMYLSRRLAKELPGYELTSSAYCQTTRREVPPELAAEAARVGGEVRWYAPERRLVAAVKFPPAFRHTAHARWCIRRERSRQFSRESLHRRGLDPARWEEFLDTTLEKLRASLELSAERIQAHGAVVELHIDVIADGGPEAG